MEKEAYSLRGNRVPEKRMEGELSGAELPTPIGG